MSSAPRKVHRKIDKLQYKNWQVYFFLAVIFLNLAVYMRVNIVFSLLSFPDGVFLFFAPLPDITISVVQGVVAALVSYTLYSSSDHHFDGLNTNSFDTKEESLIIMIFIAGGGVGIILGIVVPPLIRDFTVFTVVQTLGALLTLSYALVHIEVTKWKIENESPVVLGGVLLAVFPSLLV